MVGFEITSIIKNRPVPAGRLSLHLSRRGRLVGGNRKAWFHGTGHIEWDGNEVSGLRGQGRFDPSRPDGTPRKLLDVSRLSGMGWRPHVELEDGVGSAYRDFLARNCD
jgi:nucleoside-diphosphate-sugar epimerase